MFAHEYLMWSSIAWSKYNIDSQMANFAIQRQLQELCLWSNGITRNIVHKTDLSTQ